MNGETKSRNGAILKKILSIFVVLTFVYFCASKLMLNKKGFVSVKGASEKDVVADIAYWTISFTNSGNDLGAIRNKNKTDLKNVQEFLTKYNIKDSEIKINPLELVDLESREYKDPNQTNRFILTQSVSVITNDILSIEEASKNLDNLIDMNVSIKGSFGETKPIYKYTKINDIKQELLHEATLKAKQTADQFAKDSNSVVGNIKYANQGTIIINAKNKKMEYADESYEKEKTVRAVVSIEYWLNQ